MPFTISHAAVVLPFSRLLARWRLLSATVIGAMVPDFGLFFPWRPTRIETHSAVGLFTFCVPVGLVTYWVFQYLVKTPVLELLPESAYARWRPFASPASIKSVRQWLLAVCGVFAGAVTHLVLDGFTHEGARGVRMLPILDDPIVEYGGHYLRAVRLMQDGLSLLGLVVVVALVTYALRRGHERPIPNRILTPAQRHLWTLVYVLATSAAVAAWFLWTRFNEPGHHTAIGLATNLAIAVLRGIASGLLAVSIALSLRLRARP